MNREHNFKHAFLELFSHFDKDYNQEEYEDILTEICYESLAQAVMNNMETVYSFISDSDFELALQYRSNRLLDQRACFLSIETEWSVSSTVDQTYNTELWITEQLGFVLIRSFTSQYTAEGSEYSTSYRTILNSDPMYEDFPFSLEDLVTDLNRLSGAIFNGNVPIYEV